MSPSFATRVTVPDAAASTGIPVMPDFWKSTEYSGLCPLNVAAVTVVPHLNGTWKLGAADAVAWPHEGEAERGQRRGGGEHGEPSQPGHG